MGTYDLPAGFRFHPTDEELVLHYLCRKCASQPIHVPIIAEIDLYKYDPWLLPGMALCGEKEWYFFTPRDRKYPNGSRPNRKAGCGYWKATGADKAIRPNGGAKAIGIRKSLVFYGGKAPKGEKTNWIMHEYRLADVDRSPRQKNNLRLDDWVLCRIYSKKGSKQDRPRNCSKNEMEEEEEQKADIPTSTHRYQPMTQMLDSPDSVPRLQPTDSSSSEFTCERDVKSEPTWRRDLQIPLEIPNNYMDAINDNTLLSPVFGDPYYQDVLMYLQKLF